jgi:ribosome-associated protein
MTEPADTLPLARKIASLAEERRATDLVLLDVRGLVDYTDYFLLATGQSARQNQAIAEHVVKTLKGEKRYAISKAGLDTGRWICIDLTDVVFHVFDAETRARYDLELLWADAPRIDLTTPAVAPTPEGAAALAPAEAATLRAPAYSSHAVSAASSDDMIKVSMCQVQNPSPVLRWVRWWTMYAVGDSPCPCSVAICVAVSRVP